MTLSFQQRMAEATRLTQNGQLREATAALMGALGGDAAAPSHAADEVHFIDVEAREVGREPAPQAAASAATAQFLAGSHTEAAGTRGYKLFVPPQQGQGAPLPLVVMLHGCTQNPDDFAAGTRMNEAALAQGFLVLYPAQTQHANSSGCWNWFKHNHQGEGKGEPAILAGMTREVMARYGIDASRVYVCGLSAGGAMAAILGDAYPDLFAAVGVHSGLATGAARDMASAFQAMSQGPQAGARHRGGPPPIVFHGDQDGTVHPGNGEQVIAASLPPGLVPVRERVAPPQGRASTRSVYRDAAGRVLAEHWLVHGAGHAWSGGDARGSYTDASGPDATAQMLRFFFEHPRRGRA